MRSSDNTEAIPEFIVLAWTEVWLWQSSANTTLRLEQDFYGRHCKPYGFFFFWLGPMWICPIRRHARQREDGGTSFKGLMRCHCLTVLEIVYITHLWSVISPHFTLPLDTVKRNEKKKTLSFFTLHKSVQRPEIIFSNVTSFYLERTHTRHTASHLSYKGHTNVENKDFSYI